MNSGMGSSMNKGPEEGMCLVCLKTNEEANVLRVRVINSQEGNGGPCKELLRTFGFYSEATISGQLL